MQFVRTTVTFDIDVWMPAPLSPATQLSNHTSVTVSVVLWAVMPPPQPVLRVVCNNSTTQWKTYGTQQRYHQIDSCLSSKADCSIQTQAARHTGQAQTTPDHMYLCAVCCTPDVSRNALDSALMVMTIILMRLSLTHTHSPRFCGMCSC